MEFSLVKVCSCSSLWVFFSSITAKLFFISSIRTRRSAWSSNFSSSSLSLTDLRSFNASSLLKNLSFKALLLCVNSVRRAKASAAFFSSSRRRSLSSSLSFVLALISTLRAFSSFISSCCALSSINFISSTSDLASSSCSFITEDERACETTLLSLLLGDSTWSSSFLGSSMVKVSKKPTCLGLDDVLRRLVVTRGHRVFGGENSSSCFPLMSGSGLSSPASSMPKSHGF